MEKVDSLRSDSEDNHEITYYLNNKGVYDETFLSHISRQRMEKTTQEKIRRAKIIAKLDNGNNFPALSFNLTEIGPKLIYADFENLPEKIEFDSQEVRPFDSYIQNLGINLMVGLAQGHDYNEGIFEMPAPRMMTHRVMVICSKMPNINAKDERLIRGYFQLIFFMPKDVLEFLPSFSSIEDKIMPLIKNSFPDSSQIEENIVKLKEKILRILTEIVIFYAKYTPGDLI